MTTMTTTNPTPNSAAASSATGSRRKGWLLPVANFALAGAALAVGVVAITTDDESPTPIVVNSSDEGRAPQSRNEPASADEAPVPSPRRAGDCLAREIIVRC